MRLRADQRLFLSYIAVIVGLVAAVTIGADRLLRRSLAQIVEDDLRRELALATELHRASDGLEPDSVADLIGGLTGRRVTIVGADGRVLGESTLDGADLARMENHANRPEVRPALEGRQGSSIRSSTTVGERLLYLAGPTAAGDVVRLAVPMGQVDAPVRALQRGVLAVGGLAVAIAAILALWFSVAVTHPLRRIQAAATAMASGDLSIRLRDRRSDEFGQVAGALDSLADELQRRLGELDEEQARTRVLIDAMSEGVIALGPDGVVQRANPAAQRMFSLPARLPVSSPEAVSRRAEFLRIVKRALEGESIPPTELAGDGRSLLATAQPLPDGGAVVVLLDISELRRLEGVRRDFVANASHELKTPLTAIRGYSETLLDPDLSPDLVRRFARVVHANAERLQHIVDDLLDLSRIERGGWVVHPEEVDVGAMAYEAWMATPRPESRAQVRFEVAIEPGAERAHCDPAALRQILVNLLGNAVRYTPDGGRVRVTAAPDPRPAGEGRRGWLRIEVQDTGAGIPSVHLPRIFERFYRVDPARSREEGGTGLGLAIVKHLVEAHGGSVEAESRVGEGTTVRFTLPGIA